MEILDDFFFMKDESWGLMNGSESMPRTSTIRVQRNLEVGESGANAIIDSNINNWKESDQ